MQDTVAARNVRTKTRVFISYSRKDMAFADSLEAALKARSFEVLIDRQEIYAFEDWWKRIEALIGGADTVVFILSPDAVQSEVALKEITYAAVLNKRFAPIVCRRVGDGAVPEALRRLNFIFFDDPAQFEASTDKLTEALQTDIGWIRRHTEFGEAARRWIEEGRAGGLLLRPPVLDQAEAWIAFRPSGAPSPTAETEAFIRASRKVEVAAKRRSRILNVGLYTMLVGIILGLVGWINQASIADEWRFLTVTWPYERANVRPYVLRAAQERALKSGDSFKECAQDCPEVVVVPAGSYTMGDPIDHPEQQRKVSFARPFAVSKYELTFADWDACVAGGGCDGYKPNDQGWGRGHQPLIYVNWDDAQQYTAWLSQVTGKTYRLLSESEYEYAARAGTTTDYPWGDDVMLNGRPMANCGKCGSQWDNKQTAPVGSFPPNKFGLYDMVGNVLEWTEDCYHFKYNGAPEDGSAWIAGGDCSTHALRGGAWSTPPSLAYSGSRHAYASGTRANRTGFRVGRTLIGP